MLPMEPGDPNDRDKYAVFIIDIEQDHKPGPDGTLIPFDRIILGKKGAPNYMQPWEAGRLKKDDPALYAFLEPIYERWKKDNVITTTGHPLEAWPLITKGQIKQAKGLGLRSVEDIAEAGDGIREKFGMGFLDLQKQARTFLSAKPAAAQASEIAQLKEQIMSMAASLEEAQGTIDGLMAEKGKTAQKPARKAA
jgi:hypothetical protein